MRQPHRNASSPLVSHFGFLLRVHNIQPYFVREHRFHPERRWRFDFADVQNKIAVEIDGGAFSGGRHTRGGGFVADCEKINAAIVLGWRVFRYARRQDMQQFIEDYQQLTGVHP